MSECVALFTSFLWPLMGNSVTFALFACVGRVLGNSSLQLSCEWLTGRTALNWPWIMEWKGPENPWVFYDLWRRNIGISFSVLWHCWLGNWKGIPVCKKPQQQFPKVLVRKTYGGPSLSRSNLKNRSVKQKLKKMINMYTHSPSAV